MFKRLFASFLASALVLTQVSFANETTTTDIPSENKFISDIAIRPSGIIDPSEDEEITFRFDVEEDDVEVELFVEIETTDGNIRRISIEDDILDEENNVEFIWDIEDEDDLEDGRWRAVFVAEKDGEILEAAKEFRVEIEEPDIEDFFLSKRDFDPERGEVIFALFRTENDHVVDVGYRDRGSDDDDFDEYEVEELEVEGDDWTAVAITGDDFDEDDDVEVAVKAYNEINENIFDIKDENLKIEDDRNINANVIFDGISPIISNCNEDLEIYFTLEHEDDDDDVFDEVKISIHDGENGSGISKIDTVVLKDVPHGEHVVSYDCRDRSGKRLDRGIYSYKIEAEDGRKNIEYGAFVIDDDIGEIVGGSSYGGNSSSSDDDDDDRESRLGDNVRIITGGTSTSRNDDRDDDDRDDNDGLCAGFRDVRANDRECDYINFVEDMGYFDGFENNTFRADENVNRAQFAKVISRVFGYRVDNNRNDTAGFPDVKRNRWYVPFVKAASDRNIIDGDSETGLFRPSEDIRRSEILKMIFEAMIQESNYTLRGGNIDYKDVPSFKWYYKYVVEAERYDLFETEGDARFYPGDFVTRGELAQMLYNLSEAGVL
jgi:hypothetical protein